MQTISINITNKLPIVAQNAPTLVSGNRYRFEFTFDDEWEDGPKTVWLVYDNQTIVTQDTTTDAAEFNLQCGSEYVYVGVTQKPALASRGCRIVLRPSIEDIPWTLCNTEGGCTRSD